MEQNNNPDGTDVHKNNASRIFHVPLSAVSKKQRNLAGIFLHSEHYGMSTEKLLEMLEWEGGKWNE